MQNCGILFTNSHTIRWIISKQILNMLFIFMILRSLVLNCHWFELPGQFLTFHIATNIFKTFKYTWQSVVLDCKLSHVHIWICSIEYSEHVYTLNQTEYVTDMVSMCVKLERVMFMQFMAHNIHSAIIPEPFSDCTEDCSIWCILNVYFFRLSNCTHWSTQ